MELEQSRLLAEQRRMAADTDPEQEVAGAGGRQLIAVDQKDSPVGGLTSVSSWSETPNSGFTGSSSSSYSNISPSTESLKKARRKTTIGLLSGPQKTMKQREKSYKVKFDAVMMYLPIQDLQWRYVANQLNDKKSVQLVIEFFDSGSGNLKKIASGAYDKYLIKFGRDAKKDGRRIYVRPLHEFNGDWYPWGVYYPGNNIKDFRNAYKRIISVLKSTRANLKFQMSFAAKNATKKKVPFKDFFVGNEYVDQASHRLKFKSLCVTSYNQCGATYPKNRPLKKILKTFYSSVTKFTKRPLCIAEISSTGICKGKPYWLKQSWRSLAYDFNRVTTVNWFFENKKSLHRDWDLNSKADVKAWVQGYHAFAKATGHKSRALLDSPDATANNDDDEDPFAAIMGEHDDDEALEDPFAAIMGGEEEEDDAEEEAAVALLSPAKGLLP
ncbi:glycoside hydrolase superfamily [Tribonema minus]|uniref:Glycoside hydrolase superfamily n=1 Tax=Tribonema minus TaxID=303371 RepID=A0A835ZP96_9STRA|nr:glycoside hydrolase superfamily [Tribonema minus]